MLEYSYLYELELAMYFVAKFQIMSHSTNNEGETSFVKINMLEP